jgi:hypothetical protein
MTTSVASLMMQMVYVDIAYSSDCNEWNAEFGPGSRLIPYAEEIMGDH